MGGMPVTEYDERIRDLYLTGFTMREIADQLPMHHSTVAKSLKRQGVPSRPLTAPRRHRLPHAEMDRTVELYESGLSVERVAAALGMSPNAIWQRLNRAGVRRRSRSEYPLAKENEG